MNGRISWFEDFEVRLKFNFYWLSFGIKAVADAKIIIINFVC
jgi:hypothetical protein